MQAPSFEEAVGQIASKDPRYPGDAYFFVREALDHTQKMVGKVPKKNEVRHVSGQELLDGIREYALQLFGPMTLTVLEEWGIKRCEDFGEIVFNMVETRLLAKTEHDSREDFKRGYDFHEAFRKPFLPSRAVPIAITGTNQG
ncbi:MAG: hypothetical protein DME19_08150 [Verrucomicrobia bacterium]|nr:MAG: hypothetical protein DME19_08150 [Verrucomicrobiota bacterium]